MSLKVMSLVFEYASRARGNDLLVLLALSNWGNDQGISWHYIHEIGKYIRGSDRTVQRCLDNLVTFGYVQLKRGGQTHGKPSTYRVNVPLLLREAAEAVEAEKAEKEKGDNLTPQEQGWVTNQVGMGDKSGEMGDTVVTHININVKKRNASTSVPPVREAEKQSTLDLPKTPPPQVFPVVDSFWQWAVDVAGWQASRAALETDVANCMDYHRGEGRIKTEWESEARRWVRGTIRKGGDTEYAREEAKRGRPGPGNYTPQAGGQQSNGTASHTGSGNRSDTLISAARALDARQRARLQAERDGEDAV